MKIIFTIIAVLIISFSAKSQIVDTIHIKVNKSSPGTTLSGTGYVNVTGTVPSYVTSPIDSNSYHFIGITADSTTGFIFSKPNGHKDTLGLSFINFWKQYLNSIYVNTFNVGIGTSTPRSKLTVASGGLGISINDSVGIQLIDTTSATLALNQNSNLLTFGGTMWNSAKSKSYTSNQSLYFTPNASGGGALALSYRDSTNDYALGARFFSGNLFLPNGIITGSGTFSNNVSSYGLKVTNGFFYGTNQIASVSGNLGVGVIPSGLNNADAIFQVNSTTQGNLPPRMTKAQRDSINLVSVSVTMTSNGTGYTTAPTPIFYNYGGANGVPAGGQGTYGTTTISGGGVASTTITSGGSSNRTVTVTYSGGGGTGAAGTVNMAQVLTPGLTIYNTDINAIQTWNGNKWVTSGIITNTATLASGTVTVSAPSVISTSKIYVSYNTPSGTQGFLSAPSGSIVAGTSFVINSSSSSDNSTINWSIVN